MAITHLNKISELQESRTRNCGGHLNTQSANFVHNVALKTSQSIYTVCVTAVGCFFSGNLRVFEMLRSEIETITDWVFTADFCSSSRFEYLNMAVKNKLQWYTAA